MANELRGAFADCNWKAEEVQVLEVQVMDLIEFANDLPLSSDYRKFSLEHKLALAAAHETLPLLDEFEDLVQKEGRNLVGSTPGLEAANRLRSRLMAKLAVFEAMSGGL